MSRTKSTCPLADGGSLLESTALSPASTAAVPAQPEIKPTEIARRSIQFCMVSCHREDSLIPTRRGHCLVDATSPVLSSLYPPDVNLTAACRFALDGDDKWTRQAS